MRHTMLTWVNSGPTCKARDTKTGSPLTRNKKYKNFGAKSTTSSQDPSKSNSQVTLSSITTIVNDEMPHVDRILIYLHNDQALSGYNYELCIINFFYALLVFVGALANFLIQVQMRVIHRKNAVITRCSKRNLSHPNSPVKSKSTSTLSIAPLELSSTEWLF